MTIDKERRNKDEWEWHISRTINNGEDKITYVVITHVKTGISLGSKPILLDENCNLNQEEKNNKILEDTKRVLVQELMKLDNNTKI